jgi:hypothetical protein
MLKLSPQFYIYTFQFIHKVSEFQLIAPVHIVHLFTAHSVNFFEFQVIVIYLINKQIEHLFGV